VLNEAFIYALIGFFLLVLFFMFSALWINKRLRRYTAPLHPRQPNLRDPYTPATPENSAGGKRVSEEKEP